MTDSKGYVDITALQKAMFDYTPENWKDKVVDPEGHNSQRGTKFTARRGNNIEQGVDKAHDRLNLHVSYMEGTELTNKQMRFRLLLLEAAVAQGTAKNLMVDNFEDITSINFTAGWHDTENQRLVIL